jgi:CelD/BcsL family acetyltransferase involved in cellulose biosynthesis
MNLPEFKVQSEWGTVDLLEAIADEWRQLCAEGPCDLPFYRPEWIAAAIRAFAGRQRVLLVTVRDHGRLRALLPLLEKRSWSGAIPSTRLYSANLIPRFELVHGNDPSIEEVVRALWQHLRNLSGWDAIELINVPHGGAAERLLAAAKNDSFPTYQYEYAKSPYLLLNGQKPGGDFSRFGRSSRFRYHLRQGWRELSKQGTLRLERLEKADPAVLHNFYSLEQSGWKGRKGTAIACSSQTTQFFDEIARNAERFGYLSIYLLKLGDATLAAHLAFTYAGGYYPVKVAYEEKFGIFGPGHLIIGRVLEDCVQRGLSRFDCLGDWTDAKSKWAEDVLSHSYCGIFRNNVGGRIRRAQTQLRRELNQAAHRILGPAVHAVRAYVSKQRRKRARSPEGKAEIKK